VEDIAFIFEQHGLNVRKRIERREEIIAELVTAGWDRESAAFEATKRLRKQKAAQNAE
jgi:hypothetical protein